MAGNALKPCDHYAMSGAFANHPVFTASCDYTYTTSDAWDTNEAVTSIDSPIDFTTVYGVSEDGGETIHVGGASGMVFLRIPYSAVRVHLLSSNNDSEWQVAFGSFAADNSWVAKAGAVKNVPADGSVRFVFDIAGLRDPGGLFPTHMKITDLENINLSELSFCFECVTPDGA